MVNTHLLLSCILLLSFYRAYVCMQRAALSVISHLAWPFFIITNFILGVLRYGFSLAGDSLSRLAGQRFWGAAHLFLLPLHSCLYQEAFYWPSHLPSASRPHPPLISETEGLLVLSTLEGKFLLGGRPRLVTDTSWLVSFWASSCAVDVLFICCPRQFGIYKHLCSWMFRTMTASFGNDSRPGHFILL